MSSRLLSYAKLAATTYVTIKTRTNDKSPRKGQLKRLAVTLFHARCGQRAEKSFDVPGVIPDFTWVMLGCLSSIAQKLSSRSLCKIAISMTEGSMPQNW
jgi:hypothetical protein